MFVPNRARRSVVFVGDLTERDTFRPRGTAFIVGIPSSKQGMAYPYLVTAQHVIVMLQELGKPIYCRLNRKDGPFSIEALSVPRWWYHPDAENEQTDVAVAAMHINWDITDHEPIPMPEKWEPNPLQLGRRGVGLGDETFTIGLFRRHVGTERNVPIVRIGNIAALPEELISTRWGLMKGYLVEMRSIAGLSGSPVFVDLPSAVPPAFLPGSFVPDVRYRPPDPNDVIDWFRYRFLGLVHGHFDLPNLIEDSVVDDADTGGGINTGIGIVIPAEKIIETLYQPELIAERQRLDAIFDQEHAATPDGTV
jgi:hypothetical protein